MQRSRYNLHQRAHRQVAVEFRDLIVMHADAAGGSFMADAVRAVRAMDADSLPAPRAGIETNPVPAISSLRTREAQLLSDAKRSFRCAPLVNGLLVRSVGIRADRYPVHAGQ